MSDASWKALHHKKAFFLRAFLPEHLLKQFEWEMLIGTLEPITIFQLVCEISLNSWFIFKIIIGWNSTNSRRSQEMSGINPLMHAAAKKAPWQIWWKLSGKTILWTMFERELKYIRKRNIYLTHHQLSIIYLVWIRSHSIDNNLEFKCIHTNSL